MRCHIASNHTGAENEAHDQLSQTSVHSRSPTSRAANGPVVRRTRRAPDYAVTAIPLGAGATAPRPGPEIVVLARSGNNPTHADGFAQNARARVTESA